MMTQFLDDIWCHQATMSWDKYTILLAWYKLSNSLSSRWTRIQTNLYLKKNIKISHVQYITKLKKRWIFQHYLLPEDTFVDITCKHGARREYRGVGGGHNSGGHRPEPNEGHPVGTQVLHHHWQDKFLWFRFNLRFTPLCLVPVWQVNRISWQFCMTLSVKSTKRWFISSYHNTVIVEWSVKSYALTNVPWHIHIRRVKRLIPILNGGIRSVWKRWRATWSF